MRHENFRDDLLILHIYVHHIISHSLFLYSTDILSIRLLPHYKSMNLLKI